MRIKYLITSLRKIFVFIGIYGVPRTVVKVLSRGVLFFKLPRVIRKKKVAVIGCGQFAFANIGYHLYRFSPGQIIACYDIDPERRKKFSSFYNVQYCCSDFEELLEINDVDVYYIASNHASHTDYALRLLPKNKAIYIEKPVAVKSSELIYLISLLKSSEVYVGYNRPHASFSKVVRDVIDTSHPISLSCFISGHHIPQEHWYRLPTEGTRICGNMGHWIDYFIFLLGDRLALIKEMKITIVPSSTLTCDDNVTVVITSGLDDICTIHLGSRFEPFEGIKETINILNKDNQILINDFRNMELYKGSSRRKIKVKYKDVGHKNAILQPFRKEKRFRREWLVSSYITVRIAEAIQVNQMNLSIYASDYSEFE